MTYVFVFLGEFGYELLNWQGVVRKFSRELGPDDRIIVCSRANVYPLYETAHRYFDISDIPAFRTSVACGYFALRPDDLSLNSAGNLTFDRKLRRALEAEIRARLELPPPPRMGPLARLFGNDTCRFIFSSEKTLLRNCAFGCDRARFGSDPVEGNIYDRIDLGNNKFQKIEPDLRMRRMLEGRLGFSLDEPFVLSQTRRRQIVVRSSRTVPNEQLLTALAQQIRVVLLEFDTGRTLDSYSQFARIPGTSVCACRTFVEQTCLIHFSRHCVFFTEGDFGSHIYVPPLVGRDVSVVAPADVYRLGTTPIDFWNRAVFRFGGQIVAKIAEDVFASPERLGSFVGSMSR
jgi:hypothetical protein